VKRLLFSCALLTAGCPDPPVEDPANQCFFARDGVCDEPANCALGTDGNDCDAVCGEAPISPRFGAACAHRGHIDEAPERSPGASSGGSGGAQGVVDGTLAVPSGCDLRRDVDRHYRLFVPSSVKPGSPAPLVLMLPGHRVDLFSLPAYTQLNASAERNGFIVAYTEQEWRGPGAVCRGGETKWAWWTDWDWARRPRANPDLLYFTRLVEAVGAQYAIDQSRVYAVGHSRGGAMSVIAALELPELFAGACSQSGFTEFDYDERIEAYDGPRVPMFFVHGSVDTDVPVGRSDAIVRALRDKGWTRDRLDYFRLADVTHRWQPQLNQEWWDFLSERPLGWNP
jgi:predicted esterase